MGSGISRGALKWSGGKVSYKESGFRVFGKVPIFFGRVSESFVSVLVGPMVGDPPAPEGPHGPGGGTSAPSGPRRHPT